MIENFLSPETPFYIVGLLGVVYYLQRQINKLEARCEKLQVQLTALYGIATAAKACQIKDCRVRDLTPQEIFQPSHT